MGKKTRVEVEREQKLDEQAFLQKLKEQVIREYELWSKYIAPKIRQYEERLRKRNPQRKSKSKVLNINLVSESIDIAVSVSYSDALSVRFVSRDGFLHQEQADKLQYVAEFDSQEAHYQQIKYQSEWDRYYYGVSIRFNEGREDTKKHPIFTVIDPMTWIPDPLPSQTGKFNGQNYRFHGFSMQTSIWDMINAENGKWQKLYKKKDLNSIISDYTKEQKQSKKATDSAWNYDQTTVDSLVDNFSLGLYYHFTIYEGKKVFTVWNADRSKLLRYVELGSVLQEEKENQMLIPRPIVLTYFKPRRNDAFGESFCDLLEDKEKAKSILANLSIIKAQKEARGWKFIVNSRLITNKEAVLESSPYESYIFTTQDTEDENISNALYELPQSQIKSDVFSMIQFIENEAKGATAQDDLQKGIIPDKTMTKAEAQQAQANNNIRSLLKNTVASRGEKDFWFLRWRCYCEYFAQSDKKFVALNNNFEYSGEKFHKDEFLTGLDPHIMVGTRSELDSVDEQQAQFFTVQVLPMLQSPMIPEGSKKMMIRHWFRLNKMKANQIYAFMPLDATERKCKAYVEMVNQDIMPESIFEDPSIDFQTLRIYLQNAKATNLKDTILGAISGLLIQQGGMQAMEQYSQVANSASNIALSQGMQGMNQGLQTRQDVLPAKE